MLNIGITGVDIHKLSKPTVPEMGGISILIGMAAVATLGVLLLPSASKEFLTFFAILLIAGLIGILDDLYRLHPLVKPVLTAFASLPIFIFHTYSEHPVLPLVGRTRLTLLYPLLIPFAIAIPANAVNMMDVLNGTMTGTCSIVVFTLLICAFLFNRLDVAILCAGLLGCLLALHQYNKYPAKIFVGDTGSLAVGAGIGALVIMGGMEFVGVVALMPHIMNAFYGLASVGKLYEHRTILSRPITLLDDGKLAASKDPAAPITLTRMILAGEPMTELEVIRIFLILTSFCCTLAFITGVIMLVMP